MSFKEGRRVFMVQTDEQNEITKLILVRIVKFDGRLYSVKIADVIVCTPQKRVLYKIGAICKFADCWIEEVPLMVVSKVKEIIKSYSGYLEIFNAQLRQPKEVVIFT